jgi:hypothetical protein
MMKKHQLVEIIPAALQELHDAGIERAYVDQLGEQVTLHDKAYLARRAAIRSTLGRIGIDIPEMPNGHLHPRPYRMYPALTVLESTGVVTGAFEPPREDGSPSRRQYFLTSSDETQQTEWQ